MSLFRIDTKIVADLDILVQRFVSDSIYFRRGMQPGIQFHLNN